ncbi:MAG TPA: organic hydroperoxide resistance protein [Gemmatimonadales bacterium]
MTLTTVQYTAKVHTTRGRDGTSRADDGRLDVRLSIPGTRQKGTNPEQLFAAGWSACFLSAVRQAAGSMRVRLPTDLAVDAEVDLCNTDGEYFLRARLIATMPGLERDVAQELVDAAHRICPYSQAIRCNIEVTVTVA